MNAGVDLGSISDARIVEDKHVIFTHHDFVNKDGGNFLYALNATDAQVNRLSYKVVTQELT